MKKLLSMATFGLFIFLAACHSAPPEKPKLTVGEVKQHIKKGKTNQQQVLENFGSPNLITQNADGNEVWDYSRMSYDANASASGRHFIFRQSAENSSSSSTKSFDLVITFDDHDIVEDYKVISANY